MIAPLEAPDPPETGRRPTALDARLSMVDLRTNEWLTRLQDDGPNLASLCLAALIVVELARIAVSLLGSPVKSPQPVLTRPAQSPARGGSRCAKRGFRPFVRRSPKVDSSTQDTANAPLSSANLVLTGTIATQDPKHGVAIISDGGPSKVFAVGDNVSGASLHSVYLDHVILDRGGALETLVLPRQVAASTAMPLGP